MTEILILKLLHLLGFAYWLGGDIGVYCASYPLADNKLTTESRVTSAKILFTLDQIPRMCMTMMLPLGIHLAWKLGALSISTGVMSIIWLASFGWLAMVIALHVSDGEDFQRHLTRVDIVLRLLLSTGLVVTGLASLTIDTPELPYWLALKLSIFGVLIGFGLMIRLKIRPFAAAFANMASGNGTDADNSTIRDSVAGARPYVVGIWIGLIVSAALGIHLI